MLLVAVVAVVSVVAVGGGNKNLGRLRKVSFGFRQNQDQDIPILSNTRATTITVGLSSLIKIK